MAFFEVFALCSASKKSSAPNDEIDRAPVLFVSALDDQTQPHRVASSAAPTAVVVHSGLSAKGVGKGVLVLILLVLLVGGALIVAEDVAVVVCLAFAGPPLVQPIY